MERSISKKYAGLQLQSIPNLLNELDSSKDAKVLVDHYIGSAMPSYTERVYSCFGTPVQIRVPDVGDPVVQVTSTDFAKIRFVFNQLENILKIPESERVDGWIEESIRDGSEEILNSDYSVGEFLDELE
jgi:hypothetical protein